MSEDYYILINDQEIGPFALEELRTMVANGEIPAATSYARPGMSEWRTLSEIVEATAECRQADGKEITLAAENGLQSSPGWTFDLEAQQATARYDDSSFYQVMQTFQELRTLEGVETWDPRAQAEVRKILEALKDIDATISRNAVALDHAKREFEQMSFLKRTFGHHDEEHEIAARVEGFRKHKMELLRMVGQLQQAIDFTPNTREAKDVLLKELRLRKKQLQAEKREVGVQMTAIRKEARVASVHAGKTWLGLYDSELAADQRRGIRYAKEAALRPCEDTRAAIERQLIQVDKDLLWVERFE